MFGVSVLSVCEEMASEYVTDDSENESMSESMSCSSSSDQDNSEIVEDVLAGSYQPYAHEPLAETSDEDEQEEVDVDGIPLQEIEDRYEGIQTIENWCCCGHWAIPFNIGTPPIEGSGYPMGGEGVFTSKFPRG